MTRLSVNLNKIALLRNARDSGLPSVTRAATIALHAGAAGITVHPRPDARHVRASDVRELALLLERHPEAEFNIEGNPFHNLMPIALETRPHQCTLVPDDADAVTSNSGWALPARAHELEPLVARLHAAGVRVSLFMDPAPETMRYAREIGADRVELYTESFARAPANPALLARYVESAHAARVAGLAVNAGHDLNLQNVAQFVEAAGPIAEVSIGHALIGDALEMGLDSAVRAYVAAIASGRRADTR
ncbi:MAG: pyridoxine 5'-phosphate synthase [Proteobacteria bacterium]|nr:pyridoxine 5'-phosphate synthase [Burkholderiales bacterium]